MSISAFRKTIAIITAVFFLIIDLQLFLLGFSEVALAAVQAQEPANTPSQTSNDFDEEDAPYEETPSEAALREFYQTMGGLGEIIDEATIIFERPPSLIFDPFDAEILDLYLDPEKILRNSAEPGTDKEAFRTIIQDQFGFDPFVPPDRLDSFEGDSKLYSQVLGALSSEQSLDRFISRLEEAIQSQFVTEANKAVVERMVELAKDFKSAGASKETAARAARDIVYEFTRIFQQSEDFTPVVISLFRAIEPLPLDRRVINTLNYLVTERDKGGAGHERIKIQRIWRDYDTKERSKDREVKDADNESPHFRGQAIDISEIDNIKCTLYKSGWFKRKKTPRPPIPIKVAFQSEDTLSKTVEGSSSLPLGYQSMFEVFKDMALGNIADGLSDLDLEDLDERSLKDASLSDILKAVGEQMVLEAFGLVAVGGLNGFNFSDVVNKVGRALIADKLGLPRYAVRFDGPAGSDSLANLEGHVGRADLEQRLSLPPESLVGRSMQQILEAVGARKLEKLLQLRKGTLTNGPGGSNENLKILVGQGYIEQALALLPGTFAGNTADDVKRALGDFRFKATIAQNPTFVDDQLKISAGTTAQFLSSGDALSLKRTVGTRVLDDAFRVFPSYKENVLSQIDIINQQIEPLRLQLIQPDRPRDTISELSTMIQKIDELLYDPRVVPSPRTGVSRIVRTDITAEQVKTTALSIEQAFNDLKTKIRQDPLAKQIQERGNIRDIRELIDTIERNLRLLLDEEIPGDLTRTVSAKDDVFGTPRGSLDRFLNGEILAQRQIGAQELAGRLSYSTQERRLIYNWLLGLESEIGPAQSAIVAATGLDFDEFIRFISNGSSDVLRKLGERRLFRGITQLPEFKQFEQQLLRDNPELAKIYTDVNFRLDRLRDIKASLTRIDNLIGRVDESGQMRGEIERVLRDPTSLEASIRRIGQLWDKLDRNERVQTSAQARDEMESIRRNLRAIIDGRYPRDISTVDLREIKGDQSIDFHLTVSPNDLFDLISKRKTPVEVIQTIGFRAVEGAVGLPPESLFLFSKVGEKSPENFFASVGEARIQYRYGKGDIEKLIEKNRSRADIDLALKKGTTEAFLQTSQTIETNGQQLQSPNRRLALKDYLELVGRQALIFSSVKRLSGGLRIDGLTFTPDDIYLLVTGGAQDVFARVAGYQLDQKLGLYPGAMRNIIAARNGQERDDAIAIAGGAYLGNLLGIGPIDFRGGNPIIQTGSSIIENTLGLKQGSVRKSKVMFLSQGEGSLEEADPKSIDKLFDDPSRTDRLLRLTTGTTQKLHDGQISLEQYVGVVGRNQLRDRFATSERSLGFLAGIFGIDPETDFESYTKLRIVTGNLYEALVRNDAINKSFDQWSANDRRLIFQAFETTFGLRFDELVGFRPGTFAQIFAHPEQARQITLREGIRAVDEQFGLGGKVELVYNFYVLQEQKQEERETQRTMLIKPETREAYSNGYNDGQTDAHTGELTGPGQKGGRFNQQAASSAQTGFAYIKGYDDGVASTFGNVRFDPPGATSGDGPAPGVEGFFRRQKQKVIEQAQLEAAQRIQQIVLQQFGLSLSVSDLYGIANGDVRVFQYIGLSKLVQQFRNFAGTSGVPPQYEITYDDLRAAFEGKPADLKAIKAEGDNVEIFIYEDPPPDSELIKTTGFDIKNEVDRQIALDEYVRLKREEAEGKKASELKHRHQAHVQYKMMDIVAYRIDANIPVGFSEALLGGSFDSRNRALVNYLENRANRNDWLDFDVPQGTLQALYDYFQGDRNDAAFQRLAQTGIFGSLEIYLNREKLLGFELPSGTLYAAFRYAQTGNPDELNPFTQTSLGQTLGAILTRPVFSWADKTFKLPPGTSFQVASLSFQLAETTAKVAAAQGILARGVENITDTQLLDAEQAIKDGKFKVDNLKGALASLVVTTVFSKQLLQLDKALGLVPGSMGLLVGQGITLLFVPSVDPVSLGITLGLFLLMNIFGFNKTQLLCTGDGYYPRIGSPSEDLYLGLGEFDGMNPSGYRQGLMQAARGRIHGLIDDIIAMPYHKPIVVEGRIVGYEQTGEPLEDLKPAQILTRRPEDFQAFFGTREYAEVFNQDPPGPTNRQGILTGPDYLVEEHVHIGF